MPTAGRVQPRTVRVDLGSRGYTVQIGRDVLDALPQKLRVRCRGASHAAIVADAAVEGTAQRLKSALSRAGLRSSLLIVRPSEPHKSLATLERILTHLAAHRHERADPVIALGGGIVGDLAGFAAATYRRGVPLIQCPTTLLAMVDASTGGKTGVNLASEGGLLKNMAGAFHQPAMVLCDVSALATLPDRSFNAGLAECVKHALVCGHPRLFEWMLRHHAAILARDEGTMTRLVAENVAVKARIVEKDEFETSTSRTAGRALLNLGHTFGHALETLEGVRGPALPPPLQHGEAVALGLRCAAAASEMLGLCDPQLPGLIESVLELFGLPTRIKGLPAPGMIRRRMGADKKVIQGALRLVLPTTLGSCVIVADPPDRVVTASIAAIRA